MSTHLELLHWLGEVPNFSLVKRIYKQYSGHALTVRVMCTVFASVCIYTA